MSVNLVRDLLNDANYTEWSVRLRTYLEAQGIWDVVEEEDSKPQETDDKTAFKSWKKRNAMALYAIHSSCDSYAFTFIRDIASARIAWQTLAEKFTGFSQREHAKEDHSESIDRDRNLMNESLRASNDLPTISDRHRDLGAFFDAARSGDLIAVRRFLSENPDAVRAIHPFYSQTALHLASISGQFRIVEELVSRMREEDLEIRAAPNGYTALAISTISGDTRIAECMVRRNRKIVSIADDVLEFIPVEFALLHGHKEMGRYLYSVTPLEALLREKGVHGATVITYCIYLQCYGFLRIYEMKSAHSQSSALLNYFCQIIRDLDMDQVKRALVDKALHESAARGIDEFFNAVLRANPELVRSTGESGKSVFMKAIEFRQPQIFCLIHGMASKKAWTGMVDRSGNTMLHMAALLAPPNQLGKIPGAALQMQRELQWFKEVETIILPHHLELRNSSGYTARELFTQTHRELMIAGEKWMKDTASSCSLVGSIITTMTFAVAFTVPGGSEQTTGFPVFLKQKLFRIFVVSDAVSLFSSTASVLMFLGILTSRYSEDDFLQSLPTKLVIGLLTLFFSLATMAIAFCAALSLVLQSEAWFVVPVLLLASLPVSLFAWMQFPLLIQIFYSTFGPSIFVRRVAQWL